MGNKEPMPINFVRLLHNKNDKTKQEYVRRIGREKRQLFSQ